MRWPAMNASTAALYPRRTRSAAVHITAVVREVKCDEPCGPLPCRSGGYLRPQILRTDRCRPSRVGAGCSFTQESVTLGKLTAREEKGQPAIRELHP